MRSDIVPGAIFPDYELSDHTAKRRKLFELQGPHPMVLVLSRGGFCPKDRRQAERLLELYREMEVGYCRLVTISTDNITETNEYRTGVGAHWPFLSDTRRIIDEPRRDFGYFIVRNVAAALSDMAPAVEAVEQYGAGGPRTHRSSIVVQ
jgi:peroxiredoxin